MSQDLPKPDTRDSELDAPALEAALAETWKTPPGCWNMLATVDHKIIGLQFLFTSILMLGLGGILALLVRIQLAWPHAEIPILRDWFRDNGGRMPESFYNMLFSMHATVMIFFVIIPFLTGAFGNFTIPLMIGAPDMAFPKLNMMSYWFMWPAFAVMLISFFVDGGAAAAGWTSYPTLASASMPPGEGWGAPSGSSPP